MPRESSELRSPRRSHTRPHARAPRADAGPRSAGGLPLQPAARPAPLAATHEQLPPAIDGTLDQPGKDRGLKPRIWEVAALAGLAAAGLLAAALLVAVLALAGGRGRMVLAGCVLLVFGVQALRHRRVSERFMADLLRLQVASGEPASTPAEVEQMRVGIGLLSCAAGLWLIV